MNPTILTVYKNYLNEVQTAAEKDARKFRGLTRFVVGGQGEADRLMPDFDAKVEAELTRLSEQPAESAEVRELMEWMLRQVEAHKREPPIKYAFMAVQRHLIPLAGCLTPVDAAAMAKRLEAFYPRLERFPVHTELILKLKARADIE